MSGRRMRLTGRAVAALRVDGRDRVFWDAELAGFGVRVYPSGRKVYVVQARAGGAPRREALGAHGALSAEQARKRAAAALARLRAGGAAASVGTVTVAALAARYMAVHVAARCNAHTARIYRGVLDNHILPALGELTLGAVGPAQAAALHRRLRATPRAANRALGVLSRMFALAEAWGLVPAGSSPCRGVRKYREGRRARFLTRAEYRRLGAALARAEAGGWMSPHAVAALRLVMLTGCRVGEVLALRWDDVDRAAGELRLREAKSGSRMVPLTPAAARVLGGVARLPGNPWVICGRAPGARLASLTPAWYRLRARAGLEDVRIHDLRHSFASRALAAGESLSMIARLLGHSDIRSAARYAHLARGAIARQSGREPRVIRMRFPAAAARG